MATLTNLTELEKTVVSHLKGCDQYDERFYDSVRGISECTGIKGKSLSGVISSLVEKDIVNSDRDFFRKGDHIVFLLVN